MAGQGLFNMAEPCWTCQGPSCSLKGDRAELGPTTGASSSASAFISVPGGGLYTLSYLLSNGAGTPNSWQAMISSQDGSFEPLILDILVDSPELDLAARRIPFTLTHATTVVKLAFNARQVRPCHPKCVL